MDYGIAKPESIVQSLGIIEKGMQIADFGCGAGYYTVAFAKLAEDGKVYAFDVMESALEATQARAARFGLLNIVCVRANLESPESTGLASGSLDFIWLANILFQTEKKDEIVNEAARVLKPGGFLALVEWSDNALVGPKGYKISKTALQERLGNLGFFLVKEFPVDEQHYGLLLRKS